MRTKVEENEEVLAQRQALVESKSPVELSEIRSLAELPIPSRIEAWLHGNTAATVTDGSQDASPMTLPRNKKELHEAVYRTLPTSLVQPCVVRSKVGTKNISPHKLIKYLPGGGSYCSVRETTAAANKEHSRALQDKKPQ